MNDDRKHLTGREVERLLAAAQGTRNARRDRCLLLLMFRHGLRVSEAVGLTHVDLEGRTLHVNRLKRGLSTNHPLRGDELRVLRAWLAERAKRGPATPALFISKRRRPLNRRTAWHLVREYGRAAGLEVLLRDAISRTVRVAEVIGVRALLVHALSDPAAAFYESQGFHPSPTNPRTLLLPLSEI